MFTPQTRAFLRKTKQLVWAPLILRDYLTFRSLDTKKKFQARLKDFYPQVKDKTVSTSFDRHYVYHTAWAARKVREINPVRHVDISSSLYFSAIISAFLPVDFYDYRPADLVLDNLRSAHANVTKLPFPDNSVPSISCMHTIEHIGLGRYGDPIDPEAHVTAIKELVRVTEPGGFIIFVVPIGKQPKIEFNAHRIFTYKIVCELFDSAELVEFSLIPEHEGPMRLHAREKDIGDEQFACGCFLFQKENHS